VYKQAGDSGSVQTTGADNDMRQYNTDAMETIMGSECVILPAVSNSKSEDTASTMLESPPWCMFWERGPAFDNRLVSGNS